MTLHDSNASTQHQWHRLSTHVLRRRFFILTTKDQNAISAVEAHDEVGPLAGCFPMSWGGHSHCHSRGHANFIITTDEKWKMKDLYAEGRSCVPQAFVWMYVFEHARCKVTVVFPLYIYIYICICCWLDVSWCVEAVCAWMCVYVYARCEVVFPWYIYACMSEGRR